MDAGKLVTFLIMRICIYCFILCSLPCQASTYSREELEGQLDRHVGDTHGYMDLNTGQSKLGDISPDALPLCIAMMNSTTEPELSLAMRVRYSGIVANYLFYFPDRISPELRKTYLDKMLLFFDEYCLNRDGSVERNTGGIAFAHISYFYDKRILELGRKWLNIHPEFGERHQVYYYEKKFRDMEKMGYSPEKWREIVQRNEPPLGPLNEQRNAETTKQRIWWFALLGLILLVPFTVWIKRGSKRSNDK
jgi:hypothetical protein